MECRISDKQMSIMDKLGILTDAAKYDVACTSSGTDRNGDGTGMGNAIKAGICHSFSGDGRCISLLKILFTNECIYDCKYCINRCSNDVPRASFTPEEVCRLTIEFYRRNYIEGLFLSSGILYSPDYTMELLYRTLFKLRREYNFQGYIHVKAIPGANPELVRLTGFLADRMSVNLELPTAEGLRKLAPGKTRDKILKPMRQIQRGIVNQMAREGLLEKKGIILPPGFLTDSLRTAPAGKTPGPRTELSESLPQAAGGAVQRFAVGLRIVSRLGQGGPSRLHPYASVVTDGGYPSNVGGSAEVRNSLRLFF